MGGKPEITMTYVVFLFERRSCVVNAGKKFFAEKTRPADGPTGETEPSGLPMANPL
jgi:hypothetical protein